MSDVNQKYAFENGTVPREPLSVREQIMLTALERMLADAVNFDIHIGKARADMLRAAIAAGKGQ